MFTITTTYTTSPTSGAGKVVAKGHGKQRTVAYDHSIGVQANHAAAVGALLNVLTTPEQQAKVKHPSGAQRVREHCITVSKSRWTIDV